MRKLTRIVSRHLRRISWHQVGVAKYVKCLSLSFILKKNIQPSSTSPMMLCWMVLDVYKCYSTRTSEQIQSQQFCVLVVG